MIIWKHKPNTPKATEIEKHTYKKKKKNWNAGRGDTDANPNTY